MSQVSGEKSDQPATVRAEELLDDMGHRLGLLIARAGQRIQNTATYVREQTDRIDQARTTPGVNSAHPKPASAEEKGKQAMEKSEELVDLMVQRLSYYAGLASFQLQKAAARAREEAEDIWAEAQNIRQENSRKLQ